FNTADGGVDGSGPNSPAGSAYGGALYVAGGTVSSSGTLFSRNEAVFQGQESLGDPSTAYGGAIYVAAGHVSLSNDTVTANGIRVGGLAANTPLGGGLYVAGGTVTMRNDAVSSNSSILGGGIFIATGATVYLDSFTVNNTTGNGDLGLQIISNIAGTYILLT